jgi:hypothetical protein
MPVELQALVGHTVTVKLTREPWGDCFNLALDNGHTEELEPEETRKWFKEHLSKALCREAELKREEAIEKVLDEAWNFREAAVVIEDFNLPLVAHPAYAVKL